MHVVQAVEESKDALPLQSKACVLYHLPTRRIWQTRQPPPVTLYLVQEMEETKAAPSSLLTNSC